MQAIKIIINLTRMPRLVGGEYHYYKNGPFTDKSGGLIIFSSDSHEKAEEIISKDPLLKEKAIKQHWLKEWIS